MIIILYFMVILLSYYCIEGLSTDQITTIALQTTVSGIIILTYTHSYFV